MKQNRASAVEVERGEEVEAPTLAASSAAALAAASALNFSSRACTSRNRQLAINEQAESKTFFRASSSTPPFAAPPLPPAAPNFASAAKKLGKRQVLEHDVGQMQHEWSERAQRTAPLDPLCLCV
jgi:hypothetical protein